jgi:adenylate cyclase
LRALPRAGAYSVAESTAALDQIEAALRIDPNYGAAHSLAAWCHHTLFTRGGLDPVRREAALRHARAALASGTDDAMALATAGFVVAMEAREIDTALGALDRALAYNPNSALAHGRAAQVNMFAGQYDKAIEHANRSIRLSPLDPLRYVPQIALAFTFFLTERFPQAAEAVQLALQSSPNFVVLHLLLAASYVRQGRLADARGEVQRSLDLQPDTCISTFLGPGFSPNQRDQIAAALREAGLSE